MRLVRIHTQLISTNSSRTSYFPSHHLLDALVLPPSSFLTGGGISTDAMASEMLRCQGIPSNDSSQFKSSVFTGFSFIKHQFLGDTPWKFPMSVKLRTLDFPVAGANSQCWQWSESAPSVGTGSADQCKSNRHFFDFINHASTAELNCCTVLPQQGWKMMEVLRGSIREVPEWSILWVQRFAWIGTE